MQFFIKLIPLTGYPYISSMTCATFNYAACVIFFTTLILMKHLGSSFPYKYQRELELMKAFRQELSEAKHINMDEIFKRVVKRPCSRFWVTEERAAIAVSAMLRGGGDAVFANNLKRQMYKEIFRKYQEMRITHKGMPMAKIIFIIVNSPAPHFYLSPSQAKIIINSHRSKR